MSIQKSETRTSYLASGAALPQQLRLRLAQNCRAWSYPKRRAVVA